MKRLCTIGALCLCAAAAHAALVGYLDYAGAETPAPLGDDPWVQAMRDSGLQVRRLPSTDLTDAGRMADLSALYIHNITALTEAELAAIQRYVKAGGWLVMQGADSATALDLSGKHRFVKGEYAWKIIYLLEGACRTGLLPVTGAGSHRKGLTIERVRVSSGLPITEGTETGVVIDMPLRPDESPYPSAALHYFSATGARPALWGLPATGDEKQADPVALVVVNSYGDGNSVWATCPLAQMAADGVEFADTMLARVIRSISENTPPKAADLARLIPTLGRALEDVRAYDAAFRGGRGYSDSSDSGQLGWGEASRLLMYVRAWEVSGDEYWLDRIVEHFDRMVENLSDPDEDGYLGWQTITYSDALAWPRAGDDNVGDARIGPRLVRERAGADVTGHVYKIEFVSEDSFQVVDANTLEFVDTELPYKSGETIDAIPGIEVTITGQPVKGDVFQVRTQQVKPLEWVVHDGTVTYPIALFVEQVQKNPNLANRYGEKADEYEDLLVNNFLKKWDHTWVDIPPDMGAYRFHPRLCNPSLRSFSPDELPGATRILPHNQYLALARTFLVMADVVDGPESQDLRERGAKMCRFFKSKLRKTNDAYTFAYSDEIEGVSEGADDFSHGGLSLSGAIEAYERGVVFDEADMARFSHTLLDQIWNGSVEDARFSERVDGEGETPPKITSYWTALSAHSDSVWRLMWTILRQQPESHAFVTLWHARPEVAKEPPEVREDGD